MRRWLVRRLGQFLPTFVGVTLLVFVLVRLAPGGEATWLDATSGRQAHDALSEWRALQGHDQPLVWQYGVWLARLATLDLGRSFVDERPVAELLAEALPRTLLLTGLALLLTYLLSVPLGVASAVYRGRWWDRWSSGALFLLYSTPPFWMALVLLSLLASGPDALLPLRGLATPGLEEAPLVTRALDVGRHLVLPVLCLAYPALARTSRFQRNATLEVLQQDFVRTARAKGLGRAQVLRRHVLKNSLLPVVTLLSLDLPYLVGGSVIIEQIFTVRGMGYLMFQAILRRDLPVVMGVVALVALVTMVAVLLADLACAWLDPRLRQHGAPR